MLALVEPLANHVVVDVAPAHTAVVAWNSSAPADTIELIVHTSDGRRSEPLPYASFDPVRRSSLGGHDGIARIDVDTIRATAPIAAVEVRAQHALARVAVSTPVAGPLPARAAFRGELLVPALSQYDPERPEQRGWCTPATIAMLLGAWGVTRSVAEVAAGVDDATYGGTGNWAFAVAYAGALGFAGAVAYLRDLATVESFLAAGIPVGLSISWKAGALPRAPLDASDGHLVVVRGFTLGGDPLVNDPAQPSLRIGYPRGAFERCWLDHGGIALLVAPAVRADDLVRCANE